MAQVTLITMLANRNNVLQPSGNLFSSEAMFEPC